MYPLSPRNNAGTHYLQEITQVPITSKKERRYPLNRRLCEPQSLSAFLEKKKNPTGI
jgi:hypothetical protein